MKVLRKLLKMNTTYVDRANTNQEVFRIANQRLMQEGRKKTVVTFIDAYKQQKRKRALKIMNKPESPIYKISFSGNTLR